MAVVQTRTSSSLREPLTRDGLGASRRPAAASLPAHPRDRRPAGFAVMFQASSSA